MTDVERLTVKEYAHMSDESVFNYPTDLPEQLVAALRKRKVRSASELSWFTARQVEAWEGVGFWGLERLRGWLLRHKLDYSAVKRRRPKIPGLPVNVAPALPHHGVYFIQSGEFVKIGKSLDVTERLMDIQVGSPHRCVGLGFVKIDGSPAASARLEIDLHHRFRELWYRGEWFRDTPELRAFIQEHAQAWPMESGE